MDDLIAGRRIELSIFTREFNQACLLQGDPRIISKFQFGLIEHPLTEIYTDNASNLIS